MAVAREEFKTTTRRRVLPSIPEECNPTPRLRFKMRKSSRFFSLPEFGRSSAASSESESTHAQRINCPHVWRAWCKPPKRGRAALLLRANTDGQDTSLFSGRSAKIPAQALRRRLLDHLRTLYVLLLLLRARALRSRETLTSRRRPVSVLPQRLCKVSRTQASKKPSLKIFSFTFLRLLMLRQTSLAFVGDACRCFWILFGSEVCRRFLKRLVAT